MSVSSYILNDKIHELKYQIEVLIKMNDDREDVIRNHAKKIAGLISEKQAMSDKLEKVRFNLSEVYNQLYELCYERDNCPDALERLGNQIDIIFGIEKELLK